MIVNVSHVCVCVCACMCVCVCVCLGMCSARVCLAALGLRIDYEENGLQAGRTEEEGRKG